MKINVSHLLITLALLPSAASRAEEPMCTTIASLVQMAPSGFVSIAGVDMDDDTQGSAYRLPEANSCTVEVNDGYSCEWTDVGDPGAKAAALASEIAACLPGSELESMDLLGMYIVMTELAKITVIGAMQDRLVLLTLEPTGAQPAEKDAAAEQGEAVAASSGADASQEPGTIRYGQVLEGSLDSNDAQMIDTTLYDTWWFDGTAGETAVVTMRSANVDCYVDLTMPDDADPGIVTNNDGGGGTDASISQQLPVTGRYRIRTTSFRAGQTGAYTIELSH